MTWRQRYGLKRALHASIWLTPLLAIAAALIIAPLTRQIDHQLGWKWFDFTPDGARTVLGAFTASMLTFVVFVVSSLLIVVQLASAQLTPRIIARVFADSRLKWVLSIFTFAYTYAIAASGRIDDNVEQLPVMLAILGSLACIAIFFWFVQWLGESLRPIAVLQAVADQGLVIIEHVYPEKFDPSEEQGWRLAATSAPLEVGHVAKSGVVLAYGSAALLDLAERADVVIELLPQVGDYVARGDTLFRLHTGSGAVPDDALRDCIAIGSERTLEQDPRFAFRIMVDIANKALSPAINDPTTAVLALDQIQRLLMDVGKRRLDAGQTRDARGRLRLIIGTPNWIDYVSLAVTEIRQFGGSSIQVARRLQAMIEHLLRVLPDARKPALQQELVLLESAIKRNFPDQEDQARAQVGDFQGIGSSEHF